MIWLIGLGLFSIPVIWGILHWGGKFGKKDRNRSYGDEESTAIIVGITCLIIFTLIVGGITIGNNVQVAKHQAFYDGNTRNYEVIVDRTASYLSKQTFIETALIPIEGSIEKFNLTKDLNNRLLEWRNAVNNYNLSIASLKYFDNNPLFGSMIPDSVQDMKLLVIEEGKE